MTIKQFISKAIEGGWDDTDCAFSSVKPNIDWKVASWEYDEKIFLDPKAWQAVGKVEGWYDIHCEHCPKIDYSEYGEPGECECFAKDEWKVKMHQMIDALVDGKTLEEFIKTL